MKRLSSLKNRAGDGMGGLGGREKLLALGAVSKKAWTS